MIGTLHRARYRAKQFFASLNPNISLEALAQVEMVLGQDSSVMALFNRMSKADQHHAIAVLQTLLNWGETHPALLQAALLHDVGKSLGQPLLHRVLIVLLAAFWPTALDKLANAPLSCSWWRRPFVIHQQHPDIGATWAKEAGCDSLVITLIKTHQQKPVLSPQTLTEICHKKLYEADGMN